MQTSYVHCPPKCTIHAPCPWVHLGEDVEGDVALAALEDVDGLLMRQSLEGRTVHANDLKVDQRGGLLRI